MLIAGFAPLSRRIFHVLPTLLANVVFGRILNRPSPRGPLFVTWLLTFDCNAFCGFCGTHSLKKIFPEKMPIERALEIADEIADAGTWAVGFTGGEVFLSPLLFPLVERLKSRGVVVYIVTNGIGLAKYAQRLVELEVDVIQVSLDFADAELHDRNRKVGGLYEGALAGLREIKRLRKKRKPIIKTNTVVMKENIDDIDIILSKLESLVDYVYAQPISYGMKNSPHNRGRERIYKYVFEKDEEASIRETYNAQLLHRAGFSGRYYREVPDYWFNPQYLAETTPCWAPFLRLMIQPTGEVLHCGANDNFGVVGDLKTSSLMSAWNSPAMRQQRAIIGAKKNNCICWSRDTSFNAAIKSVPLVNDLPYMGADETAYDEPQPTSEKQRSSDVKTDG